MSVREHVTVVGAGVIGLTSGIRLREAGYDVTIIAEKRSPETTSDRAGAVFSPFRVNAHPDMKEWTRRSYEIFEEMASKFGPACGISMGMMREFFFSPLDGDPWWSGLVEGYARVSSPPSAYADEVRGIVPKMNMRRYMPWLENRFVRELDGEIRIGRVASLDELIQAGAGIVINCSGVGANMLAGDPSVISFRGQILRVRDQLGIADCFVEDGRGAITTYVFPFDDFMVLGGTFERGETTMETNEDAIQSIVERCQAMLRACGVKDVQRLADERITALAGLRPCRVAGASHESVRMEREDRGSGGVVIHNYGHGRAGVTMAWGCAEAVVGQLNG